MKGLDGLNGPVRCRRADDVLFRRSAGRMLLGRVGDPGIVELTGSGPAMWAEFAFPRDLDEVIRSLAGEFNMAPADIVEDVWPVIDQLATAGFLVVSEP